MNLGEVDWFQVFPLRLACRRSLIWSAIGRHGSFILAPAPRRCSVKLVLVGVCPRSPGGKCRARPCTAGAGGSTREHVFAPGPGARPLGNPGPPPLALAAPVAVGTGVPRAPAVTAVSRSCPLSRRPQL